DLFSFGAALYEMATGKQAFSGSTSAVIFTAILTQSPIPILQLNPELPVDFQRAVNKALEKKREARYQNASELVGELQRLKRDFGLRRGSGHVRARARRRWALAGLGVLLLALGAAVYRLYVNRTSSRTTPAESQSSIAIKSRRSVAVLGFKNLSGRPEEAW